MADPAHLEAHQERLYQQAQQSAREYVVRHALGLLDPGLDLTGLSYREALARLEAACAAERQRLDAA